MLVIGPPATAGGTDLFSKELPLEINTKISYLRSVKGWPTAAYGSRNPVGLGSGDSISSYGFLHFFGLQTV